MMSVVEPFKIGEPIFLHRSKSNETKHYKHHVSGPTWYGAEIEGKKALETNVVLHSY